MTTKKDLLFTIRLHCLECCGDSWVDVDNCTSQEICALWPFRYGKDPKPSAVRVAGTGKFDALEHRVGS